MPTSEEMTAARRVTLVAAAGERRRGLMDALEGEGLAVEVVAPQASEMQARALACGSDAVVVVDLEADQSQAMAAVYAFRRHAPRLPVVVIASNPSVELARRVRLAGVFFLGLDPLSPEELQAIISDAFECLESGRAGASVCRIKPRILIIDDDVDFCASTRSLLEAEGYAVTCATSGREGLQKISELSPDLIVLDIMMEHEWAGYEVNQAIKFRDDFKGARHIPILMASSVPIDPAARFAMASEAPLVTPDAYVTKPLDIPSFLGHVRNFVGDASGDAGGRGHR